VKTITIRDLRGRPAEVRKLIQREGIAALTANGKPVALMLSVTEDTLEPTMSTLRRARALQAMEAMQRTAVSRRIQRMPLKEINRIIGAVRKERGKESG
jgi:hypothetical protein